MITTWVLGAIAGLAIMAAHAMNMRKVWWAPIFGVASQLIMLAYVLTDKATLPMVPVAIWYLVWYALSIKKWHREK